MLLYPSLYQVKARPCFSRRSRRSIEGVQELELVEIFEIKAARHYRTIFKWRTIMRLRVLCCLAILGLVLLGTMSFGQEEEKVPAPPAPEAKAPAPKGQSAKAQDIDPKQVVRQRCDHLKNLQQFPSRQRSRRTRC